MSASRDLFIEALMARIGQLAMTPKVQVERAVAPILGLFIAELLSIRWGKRVVKISEEFPLRKQPVNGGQTYQSTNIDWLLYNATDNELIFLELKTADTSFERRQQDAYLALINRIGQCGSSFLLKDLEEIMSVSLERAKYKTVLESVRNSCDWNCRRAKLVYLAPAALRDARQRIPAGMIEWLSFRDLPEDVIGELAGEWKIIHRALLQLDSSARRSRNATQEGGERGNYADTCGFEDVMRLCQENGDCIVVGFTGGPRALRAASLDELKSRPAFKWDLAEDGAGFKDRRNWIPGRKFLELVEPLIED